ncbi:MAG: hypothetical protein K2I69_09725 [Muribaculaceae bacterium]|nr:hypothetical protein [Muribaculaceae bacterium]
MKTFPKYNLFDYIWYIGEALRKKDGNPSSGSLTLNFVWLFGILVPLLLPVMFRLFENPAAIICGLALLFLPEIFCRLRYIAQRRKEIMEHYSGMKRLYQRLFVIYGLTILFAATVLIIMFSLGFITKKL